MEILNKFRGWLGKNKKYVILIVLVLCVISWIAIREWVIVRQAQRISGLEFENFNLDRDRGYLELQLKKLQDDYRVIESSNDSMKLILAGLREELGKLRDMHKKTVDSLLNVPNDTIYVRLQPIYPNYDGSPLQYPFSGTQIRQIYTTAISYPLLSQEYALQGKTLGTCLDLNSGYEAGILNLNSQISNMEDNIRKADEQIGNYKKELVLKNNQLLRRKGWNNIWKSAAFIATGIAILK